jgi:hypothetical protein
VPTDLRTAGLHRTAVVTECGERFPICSKSEVAGTPDGSDTSVLQGAPGDA